MTPKIDEYLQLNYTVVVKENEDGTFFAEVAELPGCWAEGATVTEARAILDEAKKLWIETQLEEMQPIPEPRERDTNVQLNITSTGLFWPVGSAIVNETTQRVFSDTAWTRNLADKAEDYIENPRFAYSQQEMVIAR